MNPTWRLSKAVFKRELLGYFSNPTGYVFITLFVFLGAIAAFWQESFFSNNLANLDQLNQVFPFLLVLFIPAISMGIWAEEKKNGTDELLLTLPATDFGIVLGKYLAAVAIYSAALILSLSHVLVLGWLGNPDLGLMVSTYLGFWLMGAALLSLGMIASLLTDNLTIAFIVGAVLCAVPVFIDFAGVIVAGRFQRLVEAFSFREQFRDLASGMVTLSSITYFVSFILVMLYLNVGLLGRRHWQTGKGTVSLGWHYALRGVSLVAMVVSLTILAGRAGVRVDVTAEKIHSLSSDTRRLISGLDPDRPVFIQAYLSPLVPRSYFVPRNNIVSILREFEAIGKGRVHVKVVETEKYTPQAREAQDRFNIRAQRVPVSLQTLGSPNEIYMGIGFNCGSEEFVIPFFDPGLPVEYELMRSVRVVSHARRKRVGILETAARLFGGYDFESRRQNPDWSIVAELRKQYEVVQVPANQDYATDLDVLVAALPHTLEQGQFDRLTAYVKKGKAVLLFVDPLPAFNPELSPQELSTRPVADAPMGRMSTHVRPLMDGLGIDWPVGQIIWDKYNPHPQFRSFPPEVVFLDAGNKTAVSFNPKEVVSSGLQEIVMIYPGWLRSKGSSSTFTPLLSTGKQAGTISWSKLVQPSLFGLQIVSNLPHENTDESYVLAARVLGAPAGVQVNVIIVADVDMMGEQFFQLRREGPENLRFDNVTFLLNSVDQLAGDESFITLRKRRPRHRTLEAVEAQTKVYEDRRLKETQDAERIAEQRLNEAQARLDHAVEVVQNRPDLDEQTKRIMIANQQKVESRRFAVAKTNIEDERQRQIDLSRADMEASIRRIQNTIKLLAVALPPVPAFLLFLLVSLRRLRRERLGISADRLVLR